MDTPESRGLDFPVLHGVAEEAHAGIAGLLGVVAKRAKVVDTNGRNLVVVKIDHLYIFVFTQSTGYSDKFIVVQVELSQMRYIVKRAILN